MAISGQGSGVGATLSDGTATYSTVLALSLPGMTCGATDISSSGSADQCADFLPSIIDAGFLALVLRFGTKLGTAAETDVTNLKTTFLAREIDTWTLTLPGGATWACSGFIHKLGQALNYRTGVQIQVILKLTGLPVWTAAS